MADFRDLRGMFAKNRRKSQQSAISGHSESPKEWYLSVTAESLDITANHLVALPEVVGR
jgi:hypothetical protein